MRALRFDALAKLADLNHPVPIRDIGGWIQLAPASGAGPVGAVQVVGQLRPTSGTARRPVYGRLDALVPIGGSGPPMRVAALGIEAGGPGAHGPLCGTLRGRLAMPSRGTWIVTRRDPGTSGHRRLGPQETVPVIGQGAQRRLREPADLLAAQPSVEYGLVHASEAHRLLMSDPLVEPGSAAVTGGRAPLLADAFALAGWAVVTPDEGECLVLPLQTALRVPEPGHLLLDVPGNDVEVPAPAGAPWRVATLDQQSASKGCGSSTATSTAG